MGKRIALLAEDGAGAALAGALRDAGHEVEGLAPAPDAAGALLQLRPDAVFNALQGPFARSGAVQGLLEMLRLPYTHSGVLATALAGDRHQSKIALRAAGVPVIDHVLVGRAEAAHGHALPPPYVVKPLRRGHRLGAFAVRGERDALPLHLRDADWTGGDVVMVERYVPGLTLEVAVMGGVALGVTQLQPAAGSESTNEIQRCTPARISPNIYEKLQKISLSAHEALGCRGLTRTSFRYDDRASGDAGVVCVGIDTQPPLEPGSTVVEQGRLAGHSFVDMVAWMVEDARCNK